MQQKVLPSYTLTRQNEVNCPLLDSEIVVMSCDHNGGVITSKDGDLKITIPQGATKEGDLVNVYIATNLYGPFKLPSHCQMNLASPYYWIGVSGLSCFQKPLQVEFEHYAVVTACDPSHYQLLTCKDDDESYIMQPVDCNLSFKVQDNRSWCTFQTSHFCSYCLFHECKAHDQVNRISALYLKPKNFQDLAYFRVEIWFSFPISHCSKRNRELYSKNMDLSSSFIFEASCDKSSRSYFTLRFDHNTDGWQLNHSLSTEIQTKMVNFYNYYTNEEDLRASEEDSSFPPRFVVHVIRNECSKCLNTDLIVTLYNNNNEGSKPVMDKSIKFNLFVPIPVITIKDYTKQLSPLSIDDHRCDNNAPTLKELTTYSAKISSHWKRIALHLKIPDHKISTIDINHPNDVESKCYDMFNAWLQTTSSPCWCHFLQALCAHDVGMQKVAEEVKAHFKSF